MTRFLLDAAGFPHAETASRQGDAPRATTFAVHWADDGWWPDVGAGVGGAHWLDHGLEAKRGPPCPSPVELERRAAACCSSIACAVSAARLRLHYGLQCGSADLAAHVRRFAGTVRHDLRHGRAPWQRALSRGAPKPFSDVFRSVLAAVALDRGSWQYVVEIVWEHVRECEALYARLPAPGLVVREVTEPGSPGREEAVLRAGPTVGRAALDRPRGLAGAAAGAGLSDVRFFAVDGPPWTGAPVLCCSPRTATLRIPAAVHNDLDDAGSVSSSDSGARCGVAGPGDTVRCDVCERDFNGPGQFKEHLIGRSHRKKVNRLRGLGEGSARPVVPPARAVRGEDEGPAAAPPPAAPLASWTR